MYHAQEEYEGALNSIGERQSELIKSNTTMQEKITNLLMGDKTAEKPQPPIYDFIPSNAAYQYEPVNLKASKSKRKKRKKTQLYLSLSLSLSLSIIQFIVTILEIINEK